MSAASAEYAVSNACIPGQYIYAWTVMSETRGALHGCAHARRYMMPVLRKTFALEFVVIVIIYESALVLARSRERTNMEERAEDQHHR